MHFFPLYYITNRKEVPETRHHCLTAGSFLRLSIFYFEIQKQHVRVFPSILILPFLTLSSLYHFLNTKHHPNSYKGFPTNLLSSTYTLRILLKKTIFVRAIVHFQSLFANEHHPNCSKRHLTPIFRVIVSSTHYINPII